ncbi:MAG: DUF1203 domain-containing protein [Actinomycetota bacterium]
MSTTPETTLSYQVRAIGPDVLSQLRICDDAGREPRVCTDGDGSPLRCCLRPVAPGERVGLVSYAPLRRWSRTDGAADPGPYDEQGPVFIHLEPCPGPAEPGFPAWLARSHRVLRAYSAAGHIVGGQLVEPDLADPVAGMDAALEQVLSQPGVAFAHVRAVEYGCFLFEARPFR